MESIERNTLFGYLCSFSLCKTKERDYNTLLPDYEEAIAQSMKQPPPPYYQVAMGTNQMVAVNGTENIQRRQTTANITTAPAGANDVNAQVIPPAYDETNQTASTSESVTNANAIPANAADSNGIVATANDTNPPKPQHHQQ